MSLLKEYSQDHVKKITVEFESKIMAVPAAITVASAVLGHGDKDHTRKSPVGGSNRAPYCFMGVCHECLVEIDGVPNQQACLIEVKEGMKIKRQLELPGVDQS